jgi:hypothetical protein
MPGAFEVIAAGLTFDFSASDATCCARPVGGSSTMNMTQTRPQTNARRSGETAEQAEHRMALTLIYI